MFELSRKVILTLENVPSQTDYSLKYYVFQEEYIFAVDIQVPNEPTITILNMIEMDDFLETFQYKICFQYLVVFFMPCFDIPSNLD
jgi:hypothetical protein